MTARRVLVTGFVTFAVGLFASFYMFSLGVLYDVPCRGRWETEPGCRDIVTRAEWSVVLPALGSIILAVGIYRAVRERREAARASEQRSPGLP